MADIHALFIGGFILPHYYENIIGQRRYDPGRFIFGREGECLDRYGYWTLCGCNPQQTNGFFAQVLPSAKELDRVTCPRCKWHSLFYDRPERFEQHPEGAFLCL